MKALSISLLLLFSASLALAEVSGDYVETRSADVYVAQCFANGEMGLVGNEAIMGWHISRGSWNHVALDGLSIVGVVKARATLGDPYENPYPAKSLLIVDDRATPAQQRALLAFARHIGGELFANVVQVTSAPIDISVSHDRYHAVALLRAGNLATVQTRPISNKDHVCGNEVTFYPPLVKLSHSMPAVATTSQFTGPALGVTWQTHGRPSAFVGSFSENQPIASAALH